jgi:hypothetical protein
MRKWERAASESDSRTYYHDLFEGTVLGSVVALCQNKLDREQDQVQHRNKVQGLSMH